MKLHDLDLSGNAYKVRLFLSLIGREATLRPVDFLNREHKTQAFLRMNPRGQIPVLEDGELQLGDSHAILVYLARRHADPVWYPLDPSQPGPNRLLAQLFGQRGAERSGQRPADRPLRPAAGSRADPPASLEVLRLVERHLAEHRWLAQGEQPSIADVALYPYLALAPRAAWRWTTTRR